MNKPDLQFSNPGPFALCYAETELGQKWLDENISQDALQWDGQIVIEHRYLADIVEGARADGLVCHG